MIKVHHFTWKSTHRYISQNRYTDAYNWAEHIYNSTFTQTINNYPPPHDTDQLLHRLQAHTRIDQANTRALVLLAAGTFLILAARHHPWHETIITLIGSILAALAVRHILYIQTQNQSLHGENFTSKSQATKYLLPNLALQNPFFSLPTKLQLFLNKSYTSTL